MTEGPRHTASRRHRQREPLVPSFPQRRALPWVLAACAAAALGMGLSSGNAGLASIGGLGLGAVVVAYPVAHLLIGNHLEESDASTDRSSEAASAEPADNHDENRGHDSPERCDGP